jgi:lysozyme
MSAAKEDPAMDTIALPAGLDASRRAALEDAAAVMHFFEGCEKKLPGGLIGPYADMVGVPTIGWGNTQWPDGRKVRLDDAPITQAEADALFLVFLGRFADAVFALIPKASPSRQAAACISLAYNIGVGAFGGSSALARLKAGDAAGAAAAIELWNRAGGKVAKGLQRRRRAERLVFEGGDPKASCLRAVRDFP